MIALVLLCLASASANPVSRIVGGQNAEKGKHPHQVSLLYQGSHSCGGAILNDTWIVTAAHCTQNKPHNRYSVVINEYDRNDYSDSNKITISADNIINHPQYGQGQGAYPNDISLIHLSRAIYKDFTNIELQSSDDIVNETCTITGWGRTSGSAPLANILQSATGTLLNTEQCANRWGSNILPSHLCIEEPSSGACNGDSGGPMECIRESDKKIVLAGVTSWGRAGCDPTWPSVYTRISYYKEWIEQTMNTPSHVSL